MSEGNTTPQVTDAPFRERVKPWMLACFGEAIANDRLERNDRFIEEALELTQATGYSRDRAHALVDYVFDRPVGEPFQEVGGVRVTLAALCLANDLDDDAAAEAELSRIWGKVEQIRAKQAAKPVGSALPQAHPTDEEEVERVARALVPVMWGAQEDEMGRDLPDQQFDSLTDDWKEAVRKYARAALNAIRSKG